MKKKSGFSRLFQAFCNSLEGLRAAYRSEAAFRLEVWLSFLLIPLACYLDVGRYERLWMIVSILLVLAAELFNTALEALTDLASPSHHPLAAKTKDAASAAVLILLINAMIVWAVVLIG